MAGFEFHRYLPISLLYILLITTDYRCDLSALCCILYVSRTMQIHQDIIDLALKIRAAVRLLAEYKKFYKNYS